MFKSRTLVRLFCRCIMMRQHEKAEKCGKIARTTDNYVTEGGCMFVTDKLLFNLAADPNETTNLAAKYPGKLNELRAKRAAAQ